jgi:hypothetical protein
MIASSEIEHPSVNNRKPNRCRRTYETVGRLILNSTAVSPRRRAWLCSRAACLWP